MNNRSDASTLRCGDLARLAGVSPDTIRHYERMGLLTSRRASNGYRQFSPEALDRVRIVRRALAIGFRLEDLARIFQTRDRGGAPCRYIRSLAAARLDAVEEQIQELVRLRDELAAMLHTWDIRLGEAAEGERVCLLQSLP